MKFIYFANARIPTEKAHGIQIIQMLSAFANFQFSISNFQTNPKLKIQNPKVDVELIIPRRFNKIKEDPFEYYGIERNFKLKKIPCLDLIIFDKYIGHLGLWIESVSFFISVIFYLVFSLIKEGRVPEIIYTRDKFLLPLTIFWKNIFFEVHALPRNYFIYSLFIKRLKGIIVITSFLKEFLIEKGVSPQKIMIAPDGVELEKFDIECSKTEARKKINLPEDKKIILYTGHLYKWKGGALLLEAARKFETLNPKFETLFIFVGGTKEDVKSFKFQVLSFKIDNVLVVGHRPYSEIPYWLKAADVLVLPNSGKEDISKLWTSPLKMFEYMASKRPIVASDLPSLREILSEKNSILVEPDNPQALARGIGEILLNPQLSNRISTQAFSDVQKYSWQKRAEKICQKIF